MLQRAEEALSRNRKVLPEKKHKVKVLEICTLDQALASLERGAPEASSSLSHFVINNVDSILHKCRKAKSPSYATRLHACMREIGLESHKSLGSKLVSLLVDVGNVHNAQQVFDKLPHRHECVWTALISGYIKYGKPQQAFSLYYKMQEDCVQPSGYTFVALLKACLRSKDVEKGHQMHLDISKRGMEKDLFVGSALVDMFAKFDLLEKAQEVFNKLLVRDAMSWNALISGYARQGLCEEALDCYDRMRSEGVVPSVVTYVCSIKACGSMGAGDRGIALHAEVSRRGFDGDLVVGNTLIDMYGNCGLPRKAQEVFDKLPICDVVSWTALISGYVKHGCGEEALKSFEQMQLQNFSPDAVTLVCALKACSMTKSIDVGKAIHSEIARDGSLEKNALVGNALVDMYAKCGVLTKAQEVFDMLGVRDAASWNALITGYVKQGLGEEALICYEQMGSERVSPDAVTLSCILKACGNLGAVNKAGNLQAEVSKKGLHKSDLVVGNGLVDMYAKCGLVDKALEAFDELPIRDLVSWNSLLAGYAQLGESEKVFLFFERMVREGERPNQVTFGSILNACIHAGLVFQGQTYLQCMFEDFGVIPTIELHTCVIDLLGRAGQLDMAIMMSKEMPVHPTLVVWNTVLGACRKWGNVELGRQAFELAVGLEEKDAAAYVCMYNLYADADLLEEAKKIEAMRVQKQAWHSHGENWSSDVG